MAKKKAKKAKPKKSAKKPKIPAKQRISKSSKKKTTKKKSESNVGYKNPPKDYQLPPGQSGNPNGPPKRKTQLWVWFCKYMEMTDAELKKLKLEKLTQAQQTALKLVENAKGGKYSGSERLARYVIDRDEGKAVKHVVVENNKVYSAEECDEIRKMLRERLKTDSKKEA